MLNSQRAPETASVRVAQIQTTDFLLLFLPSLSVGWHDVGVQGQVGSFYHMDTGDETQAIRLGTWLIYLATL